MPSSPALTLLIRRTALLAMGLMASPLSDAAAQHAPFALIIGNAGYTAVEALKNPANDARQVCTALRTLGFQTSCLTDVATRADLRSAIEDYVEALPEDAVSIFYYAGHGLQVNGENYLVPTAAALTGEASVPSQTVSLSFLMRQLRGRARFLTLVILDACRNNPMAAPGRTPMPGLATITDIPPDTEVLYATADSGVAIDDLGDNGVLTRNLLAHLKDPGTVDELFKAVRLGVQTETAPLAHPQRPAVYTNFTGQYCLLRCNDPGDASGEAPAAIAAGEQGNEETRRKDGQRRRKAYIAPAN